MDLLILRRKLRCLVQVQNELTLLNNKYMILLGCFYLGFWGFGVLGISVSQASLVRLANCGCFLCIGSRNGHVLNCVVMLVTGFSV
jgi:hypothetical protein